jgi:DNA-binding GntR family transcriptional regulator
MATRKTIQLEPAIAPMRNQSLTDQIYDRVRQDIIQAKWRPGAVLLEPELATRYGVSKTPVREALRLLVQEDWIIILPRKGYLVRPLRLDDISEVFGLRMMIEPSLIADTARNAGQAGVALLAQRLAEQREAPDLQLSLDAARQFHLAVAQFARNRRAESVLEPLLDEVRRLHYLMPAVESHITSTVEIEAHEKILKAIDQSRPDEAAELMRTHLGEVAQTMISAFSIIRID